MLGLGEAARRTGGEGRLRAAVLGLGTIVGTAGTGISATTADGGGGAASFGTLRGAV